MAIMLLMIILNDGNYHVTYSQNDKLNFMVVDDDFRNVYNMIMIVFGTFIATVKIW